MRGGRGSGGGGAGPLGLEERKREFEEQIDNEELNRPGYTCMRDLAAATKSLRSRSIADALEYVRQHRIHVDSSDVPRIREAEGTIDWGAMQRRQETDGEPTNASEWSKLSPLLYISVADVLQLSRPDPRRPRPGGIPFWQEARSTLNALAALAKGAAPLRPRQPDFEEADSGKRQRMDRRFQGDFPPPDAERPPPLDKDPSQITVEDLRPYLSEERINAMNLHCILAPKELEELEKRLTRAAKSKGFGQSGLLENLLTQWNSTQQWSFLINFCSVGPALPVIELSVTWGKLIRDGFRVMPARRNNPGTAMWRVAMSYQWQKFEVQLASNAVLASPVVISDLQLAIISEYTDRQVVIDREIRELPGIRALYAYQLQDLPNFFFMMNDRISNSRSGFSAGAFSLGTANASQARESIITFNSVNGNILRPFFTEDGVAPARYDAHPPPMYSQAAAAPPTIPPPAYTPPVSYFPAAPSWETANMMPPRPFATQARYSSAPGPQAPRPQVTPNTPQSYYAVDQGGPWEPWGAPGTMFRPMSAPIVGASLCTLRQPGPPHRRCNTCPIHHEPHRMWECPLAYARKFNMPCPGFDSNGARVESAWEGAELTANTRQQWLDYCQRFNIGPSPTEVKNGAVNFSSSEGSAPALAPGVRMAQPRGRGRGRGR